VVRKQPIPEIGADIIPVEGAQRGGPRGDKALRHTLYVSQGLFEPGECIASDRDSSGLALSGAAVVIVDMLSPLYAASRAA
jgi:hypothetical protein